MRLVHIWPLLKDSVKAWVDDYAPSMGAALAYYTVFSLAPLLLIVIAVAGVVFGHDAVRGEIVHQLGGVMGRDGATAVQGLLESASEPRQGFVSSVVGFALLIVGATTVFAELQSALDRIWRVPEAKKTSGVWNLLRTRFLSFGLVLGLGFLMLISLVISAALSVFGNWYGGVFRDWKIVLHIVNIVVSLVMSAALFAMIYKFMPRARIAWSDVWIGAAVTAVLFEMGKFLLGLYLGNAGVASGFGAAGSLVLLIVWVYYSAQIFLLGAEFTWVYARAPRIACGERGQDRCSRCANPRAEESGRDTLPRRRSSDPSSPVGQTNSRRRPAAARREARLRTGTQPRYQTFEIGGVYGLGEVPVEPCFEGEALVFFLAPSGQGDDHDILAPPFRANSAGGVVAVQSRHPDVQQDDVRAKRGRFLDGLHPVIHGANFVAHQPQHGAHALRGIAVVVRDENSARTRVGALFAVLVRRRPQRHDGSHRKADDELGALALSLAAGLDVAAVHFHQLPYERQPDAQPALRFFQRPVDLREHVENGGQCLRGDADAGIADGHGNLPFAAGRGQPDVPAALHVLGGVVQQIGKDLREAHGIGIEIDRLRTSSTASIRARQPISAAARCPRRS